MVRRVLLSPLLSGGGGAYPWFGSVFGGTGMALGAGYLKRLEKAASFNMLAGISINNSQLLETRVAAPELFRGRLKVGAEASWIKARDVQYFGPGAKSNPDVDFEYDYQPTQYRADAAFKPLRWFSIGGGYSFLDLETRSSISTSAWASRPASARTCSTTSAGPRRSSTGARHRDTAPGAACYRSQLGTPRGNQRQAVHLRDPGIRSHPAGAARA